MEKNNIKNVFIIGGGPSVKECNLSKLDGLGYKLGVNDSVFFTDCQGVFSMDRTWIEKRKEHAKKLGIECYFSKKHFSKAFGEPWDKVRLYPVEIDKPGLHKTPGFLYAKNSGFGAVNVAYHWKPKNIFLFGLDSTLGKDGSEHWHPDYEWRKKKQHNGLFHTWVDDHTKAAVQFRQANIKVYNVSMVSRITAYPKIEFKDVFKYV